MSGRTTLGGSVAILLAWAVVAAAYTTNLYDNLGGIGYFGNIGDTDGDYPVLTGTTGQRFKAADPALSFGLPAEAMIDRVGLRIAVDPNRPFLGDPSPFNCKVRLWAWNTDLATTMAQAPIADSGTITLSGGFDGWVQLNCPPQPANGTYFVAVTRLSLAINGQWRVSRTNNSAAVESVCYRAGASTNSRELQVQLRWYEPACAAEAVTAVNGLTGNTVMTGANPATMTMTGANLDLITSASMVRRHSSWSPGAPISGTLQAAAPGMTSRQVTFNLAGAEGGYYDLTLESSCDRIANAFDAVLNDSTLIPLKNAILACMPALVNGSFEEAWDDNPIGGYCDTPRGKDLEEAKHWSLSVEMAGVSGSQWRRDGALYVPGCTGTTPAGGDGAHYASQVCNTIWPVRNTAFQTIVPPNLVGQVVQQGSVFQLAYHLSQASDQLVLRLRDGSPEGPEIASVVLPYTGGGPLETGAAVALEAGYTFISNPPLLTVEIQMDEADGTAPHALHFDNLRVSAGCNLPFADADGDHDVDSADFGVWQQCFGPAQSLPASAAYCSCFDQVADGHINEADLGLFLKCATGPNVTWVQCEP